MLLTACVGFKGLKWLNYIAVPLLVIVCLYGLIAGITTNDGGSAIANYAPENSSGWCSASLWWSPPLPSAASSLRRLLPLCQEPRRRGQVLHRRRHPRRSLHALTGALMSIVTGQYDISAILASSACRSSALSPLCSPPGRPTSPNAYSGGLALSNLLGFDESKFKVTTGVAGGIGTLLAAFWPAQRLPELPVAHVRPHPAARGRADCVLLDRGQGQKGEFPSVPGFSAVGVISFAVGAVFACITGGTFASFPGLVEALPFLNWPFFVGPVNGIVVSLVLYVILAKAFPMQKTSNLILQEGERPLLPLAL